MHNPSPFILLLQPWIEDFYLTDCRIQPIGLAYLAGSLKRAFPQIRVDIFDTLAGGTRRTIPWPKEFQYLKPYYGYDDKSPVKLFHTYSRFGKSNESILEYLRSLPTPLWIGISSLFSPYYRQSLALAALCKQVFPQVPIIMGGNHATLNPASLLHPNKEIMQKICRDYHLNDDFRSALLEGKIALCDGILKGEAEESVVAWTNYLLGQKNSQMNHHHHDLPIINWVGPMSSLENSPITPNRRELAWPDFTGLKPEDYTFQKNQMTFLITSRSCPHRCSFCSIHAVFGKSYTSRPALDVFAEIKARYEEGIRHFDIEDDNFTFNKKHAHELLDLIIQWNRPIRLSAMNGISYISLDKSLLAKMKQAGFSSINIALVSSDAMVLSFSNRPHTVQSFLEVVQEAGELDLHVTAYFILGMPGQTLQEMVQTLCLLASQRCLVGASPFYFTPGSPIHRKEQGNSSLIMASAKHDPIFSARLTAMDVESDLFDRTDLYTLFKLTRVINYIKEGIDQNKLWDHPYYDAVRPVFTEQRFIAHTSQGPKDLPFSQKAWSLFPAEMVFQGTRIQETLALSTQNTFVSS